MVLKPLLIILFTSSLKAMSHLFDYLFVRGAKTGHQGAYAYKQPFIDRGKRQKTVAFVIGRGVSWICIHQWQASIMDLPFFILSCHHGQMELQFVSESQPELVAAVHQYLRLTFKNKMTVKS